MYLAGSVDIGSSFLGPNHPLTSINGPSTLISLFLSNSLMFAGIFLLFIIIFAGYQIIGAGGNPQKLQGAAKYLTFGIIGFLLVFAAFFIIRIIEAMTGLAIL